MDIVIIILSIVAIFISSTIAFVIGRNTIKKQEKLNNQELLNERILISNQIEEQKDKVQEYKSRIQDIESEYESKKKLIADAKDSAEAEYNLNKARLQEQYNQEKKTVELEINEIKQQFNDSIAELHNQLESLKATRDAAIAAARKEQSIENQPEIYCFPLQEDEVNDIEYLNKIKSKMRHPDIIGKVIWSSFMQKKFNSFVIKILGTEKAVCGVYKITDQATKEAYIGQSVNIANRWRDHLKAGIGAMAASSSNQLYAAIKRDGIENFSFELLEECNREELNDKEKFFIDLYSTNKTGLNITKGGS